MSLRTTLIKKLVALSMTGWSERAVEAQRARQEKTSKYVRLPADIRCHSVRVDDVPAAWIETSDVGSGVLLYLHGGAYALGSMNIHREWIARLARATKTRVLAIDYRLAPEHPYPAALEDVLTAYRWLIKEGSPPSQIIIAGDSAGGGLTLATLVALRDAGDPLPAGAVCISPWTDLALTGASIHSKAEADPMLSAEGLKKYASYYARGHDLTTPLISPLYADLRSLPPLLIQVGSDEILLDDAVRFADKARAAGVKVTLQVWDEMFHVFHMLGFLAETKEALGCIAEFVSQSLKPT
jgi:acetyl esterase/lipase